MKSQTDLAVQQKPASPSPIEAEQRLRQAAHILANGAIRAALKRRAQQVDEEKKKADLESDNQTNRQTKARKPKDDRLQTAFIADVSKSDILPDCGSISRDVPALPTVAIAPNAAIRSL